jgi:CheY-like chemotaxis protein
VSSDEPQQQRVLVVEDEFIVRTCLAETLEDAGYRVATARDGAEALARIQEDRPDAVLLDLLMPVMDGLAFLHARHAQPRLATLPVVVLSAGGSEALRSATALRATAVLAKPVDLDALSRVLEQVLREARFAASLNVDAVVRAPQPVGKCPICGEVPYSDTIVASSGMARLEQIHAARRAHLMAHSARDVARVPMRTRLLELPVNRRRILADWLYRELRHEWGDRDRRGAYSIDETLSSSAMHRLWQAALSCGYAGCQHS